MSKELIGKVKQARDLASKIKVDETEQTNFVHIDGKIYMNQKLFPISNHFEVVALCEFIKEHEEIDADTLDSILLCNAFYFSLLKDVFDTIPNLIEEVRSHDDEKYIPFQYVGMKLFEDRKTM